MMHKIFKFLMLVCLLLAIGALHGSTAWAGAITGKIGVGTWNTQAEFADVKVVQGATTLYQSDFATGMTGWTNTGGTWATQGGYLRQTGGGAPALALVGNTDWSNYTLTLKARKISGAEGFLISFGSPGDATQAWWNIGGFGNTKHLLNVPGVPPSDVAGKIETGVWYDIKVQLSGPDVRCYLNNQLVHDTARFLDGSDRTDRFNQLINSPGFGLLNGIEQGALRNLRDRNVYIGDAARATFDAMPMSGLSFAALTAGQQALIIRKVNRNRMTWVRGFGFDGSDAWRDGYITANADFVVKMHNSLSVFDKHLTVNNSPGTPTADANYDGWMRMGGQMTVRTFVHEIAHTLGGGTYGRWYDLMSSGVWAGQYGKLQIQAFDGAGADIHASGVHFWPYGMNYENEYSGENARRAILLMAAKRRDMFLGDQVNYIYADNVPNGTYALVPRCAPGSVLDVLNANPDAGAPLGINTYKGTDSQKFLIDLQPEGTYRIRTALAGNRAVELPGGNTNNGSKVQLWDDNGLDPQRWFLIPTDNGWFKIAPRNNNFKGMDVVNASTADGTPVQSYDYLDNFAQQWKLVPTSQLYTKDVADGDYRVTPRHAPGSALDVLDTTAGNTAPIGINAFTSASSQKFLFDLQSDGTYRIRTALTGNRAVELPGGNTANSTKVQLWDDNGLDPQKWYLIPTDSGFYKIAPKNDIAKSMDVEGLSTADGSLVQSYDYLEGANQQWKLTPFAGVIPKVSFSNVSVTEGNQGTISAIFKVTLSDAPTQIATIKYTTANGTATAGSDYTATSGTLTFGIGETEKTISVPILGDTVSEQNETFLVKLSDASKATLTVTEATGTILNDDSPTLSVDDFSLVEGNAGTSNATFTVKLSNAGQKVITVKYATANGMATADSDFTSTSGTLTFEVGETEKTIMVPVKGDLDVEVDETFTLNLSEATNATMTDAQGTGKILNDDLARVSIGSVSVAEGNADSSEATFEVTLSGSSTETVTVKYTSANGTATVGSDYTAVSGTLIFAPGEISKTISVPVVGDKVIESDETFLVKLSEPSQATLAATQAVGTIINDDFPDLILSNVSLKEGNAGTSNATFTVKLSAIGSKTATVKYATVNGTATAGSDYVATSGTLTFAVGETSKTIVVPVNGDMAVEKDENFLIQLTEATNANNIPLVESQGVGLILNNDLAELSVSDVSVTEGNAGTTNATFRVMLSEASFGTVTINYATAEGSAKANSDFKAGSGILTFAPGVKVQTIVVPIVGDIVAEPGESFMVNLTGLTGATLKDGRGVGTILDNDETVAPKVVITSPRNKARIASLPTILVEATDNAGGSGMDKVELYLKRDSDGVFWTGSAWGTTQSVALPTTLQNGLWKCTTGLPLTGTTNASKQLVDGVYSISAYAQDKAGNRKATKSSFTVDASAPTQVAITTPVNASYVMSLPLISVDATDNAGGSGIARVELTLKRNADGAYWTGSAWGKTQPVALGTLLIRDQWQRRSGLPLIETTDATRKLGQGNYTITATAFDKAGNSKKGSSSFKVDTVAPSMLEILSPKQAALLTSIPTIQVVTSDDAGDSGIAKVELTLKRNSDGIFWTGGAWGTTQSVALPTTLQNGVWKNAFGLPVNRSTPRMDYTEKLTDGSYSISAISYDKVGNKTTTKNTFKIVSAGAASTRLALASAAAPSSVKLSKAAASSTTNRVTLLFDGGLNLPVAVEPSHYSVTLNGKAVLVEGTATLSSAGMALLCAEGAFRAGDNIQVRYDLLDAVGKTLTGVITVIVDPVTLPSQPSQLEF